MGQPHRPRGLRAVFLSDVVVNLVVIALGIERRVNVAKIDRLIFYLAS
jgi:hypothetical protein